MESVRENVSGCRWRECEGYRRVTWLNALWDLIVEELQDACILTAEHGERHAAGEGAREGGGFDVDGRGNDVMHSNVYTQTDGARDSKRKVEGDIESTPAASTNAAGLYYCF